MDTNKEHTRPSAAPLLSLFSGYGGLDMGVEQALGPMRPVAVCDIEPGPTAILAAHWNTPNLGDITHVDWRGMPPVDVVCGGSPCQSMSLAGLRAGMKHGTRSGLWSYQCDAIETLRPALVVWENVAGSLSAVASSQQDLNVAQERARLLAEHGLCGCMEPRPPMVDGFTPHTGEGAARVDDQLFDWLRAHQLLGEAGRYQCTRCRLPLFEHANGQWLAGDARLDGVHTGCTIRALGRVLGDLANLNYDAVWHAMFASDTGAPHKRLRVFVCAWPHEHNPADPTPANARLARLASLGPMRPEGMPFATWDRDRDVWCNPMGGDLFDEPAIFTDPWPKHGIMAEGRAWLAPAEWVNQPVHDPGLQPAGSGNGMVMYTPKATDAASDLPGVSGRPLSGSTFLATQVRLLDFPGRITNRQRQFRDRLLPTPSAVYDADKAGNPDTARQRARTGRQLGLSDMVNLMGEEQ